MANVMQALSGVSIWTYIAFVIVIALLIKVFKPSKSGKTQSSTSMSKTTTTSTSTTATPTDTTTK